MIPAASGVQQVDPFSPVLFPLTLSELLKSIKSSSEVDLQLWYDLDDGTLISPIEQLLPEC